MITCILRNLKRAGLRSWKVTTELESSIGRVDLLMFRGQPSRTVRERLRVVPPRLAVFLDGSLGVNKLSEFADALGTSLQGAKRIAREFQDRRLASIDGEDLRMRSIDAMPYADLVAIEAKLSNWRVALVQAYRNRQFSNESWVVLDHAQLGTDTKLIQFERSGVGLASINSLGQLIVHVPAPVSAPASLGKAWTVQAMLARSTSLRL